MSLSLISAPVIEPLSVADVKTWIKVDGDDDDPVIQSLITSSRLAVEAATNRLLITQKWRLTLDSWAKSRFLHLPLTPVQSINRVYIFDTSGVGGELAIDLYHLDANLYQ